MIKQILLITFVSTVYQNILWYPVDWWMLNLSKLRDTLWKGEFQ